MIAYQFSIMENCAIYTLKCEKCKRMFQTKNYKDVMCPSCAAGLRLNTWYKSNHERADIPLREMPERKDLTAEEFAECVGRLLRAMIGEAAESVAKGSHQEKVEARHFLLNGGIDQWINFAGLEVSGPLRKMLNDASEGKLRGP